MFRHYCVILRELVIIPRKVTQVFQKHLLVIQFIIQINTINTLPRYKSISSAAVGNKIYNTNCITKNTIYNKINTINTSQSYKSISNAAVGITIYNTYCITKNTIYDINYISNCSI